MANPVTAPAPVRSSMATLVIVGPPDRLGEASHDLAAVREAASLRAVLISTASWGPEPVHAGDDVAVIEQLPLEYLNNAIAALRLSSLPTVIWWRGGPPKELDGVAPLADRLVLDAEDPVPLWQRTPPLFERTALTDLRWARLTPWRAAMAQFFDLPQIRQAAASFNRLAVAGADRPQCALYAGWIAASLPLQGNARIELTGGNRTIDSVTLEGTAARLLLRLPQDGSCLAAEASVGGQPLASRVVAVGDQPLPELLAQELRVRSRDMAFERAVVRALAVLESDSGGERLQS